WRGARHHSLAACPRGTEHPLFLPFHFAFPVVIPRSAATRDLCRHSVSYEIPRCAGMTALSLGHLMASGLVGDPTAPVMGSAGATNRNSYTLSAAQSSARSFT